MRTLPKILVKGWRQSMKGTSCWRQINGWRATIVTERDGYGIVLCKKFDHLEDAISRSTK